MTSNAERQPPRGGSRTRPDARPAPADPRPVGRRRLGVQWALAAAVVGTPFLRWGGESLLRIDLSGRRLLAFGRVLRLEEFPLALPLVLALATTLLLATVALGRVWCGWTCPQTLWSDFVEGVARRAGARVRGPRIAGSLVSRVAFHGSCAALGLLVGANVVWYFLPPAEFFSSLARGDLPGPAAATAAVLAAVVYADLAFVRRTFCAELCPYGRFQAALVDRGTLTLRTLPGRAGRCIECDACAAACPTGVDIRRGPDAACINCGRCLDACARVMARRGHGGLIGYTWGVGERGPAALVTPRTALLFAAALAAWGALFWSAGHRDPLAFSVRRSATAEPRAIAGERFATFLEGTVTNRSARPLHLRLEARTGETPLEVRGPGREVGLGPGERARVEFAVVAPLVGRRTPVEADLTWISDRGPLASRRIALQPPDGASP